MIKISQEVLDKINYVEARVRCKEETPPPSAGMTYNQQPESDLGALKWERSAGRKPPLGEPIKVPCAKCLHAKGDLCRYKPEVLDGVALLHEKEQSGVLVFVGVVCTYFMPEGQTPRQR